jgi:hypothetical protein
MGRYMKFDNQKLKNILRIIGIIIFIGIGLIPIYQRFVEPQIDHINQYAELLGNKLLAMVPEGSGKENLAQQYQEFLEKVKKREVEPERVERVAAGILNASNAAEMLTPKQGEAILHLAFYTPPADSTNVAAAVNPLPETPAMEEWAKVGERLKYTFDFQEKLQQQPVDPHKHLQLPRMMEFRCDNGLKIVMDSKIKTELSGQEFPELAVEVDKLEQENLLHWQENYEKELEIQMLQLEKSLEKMEQEIKNMEYDIDIRNSEILEAVKSIQILDSLGMPVPVNVDSILKAVEAELKKANKN